MKEPEKTVLWSADSVAPNQSSIELSDSIDNYDEIIFYGSGTRNYVPNVQTYYPVISGKVNLGGPFFCGKWGSGDSWLLCNGTQVYLSGTSGFVASSYYWGKTDGGTAYNASLVNNRTNDVRPYKIVGVKYPKNYDRTLIWSATENEYGKNITLSEPVTHFKEIEVRASGFETASPGCHHAGKNIYNTQPRIMGCDAWAYSPWKVSDRHNLIIGNEMRVSGNSGFIGSGYYFGMGSNTTAWAAGKWTDWIEQALMPYEVYGLEHKPVRRLTLINGDHGTVSASILTGCEYDTVTLSNTPDADWYFSGYNITGATLTGNKFVFGDSDVTVQAAWTQEGFPIVYESDDHCSLTGDKTIVAPGETVTLTTGYDTYYRISGYDVTGGTVEGDTLTVTGPCTIRAVSKPNKFTITGNYNYGQVSYTASWDAKVRGITGTDVPTSWGTVGNNFNPGSCSAYGFTFNTKVGGWFERGTGNLHLYHYIGNSMTKSAKANGYQGYSPYTLTCTLTGTSTLTGHPKLSAWISCSYSKNTNGMPTNAWTATGYLP